MTFDFHFEMSKKKKMTKNDVKNEKKNKYFYSCTKKYHI